MFTLAFLFAQFLPLNESYQNLVWYRPIPRMMIPPPPTPTSNPLTPKPVFKDCTTFNYYGVL